MSFGTDPNVTRTVLLNLKYTDLLSTCQTNHLAQNICQRDDFWQTKYQQDFDFQPISETSYQEAYKNRIFRIDNLKIRVGYETDSFEYLIRGNYYDEELILEEEPGEDYGTVNSFTINPTHSKVIGIFFRPGDIDPMILQEHEGRLIELTLRDRYLQEDMDYLEGIQSIHVLEVPDPSASKSTNKLTSFPLKDPDASILEQLEELKTIKSVDEILELSHKNIKTPEKLPKFSVIKPIYPFEKAREYIESGQIVDWYFESENLIVLTSKDGEQIRVYVRYDPQSNKIFPL